MRNFHSLLRSVLAMSLLGASAIVCLPQNAATSPQQPDNHAGKVELKLKLPRPAFISMPLPVPRHTTAVRDRHRPPFYVPPGVTNVALDKSVTSSAKMPILGDNSLITDGNKEATDGSWVSLAPGKQWVQIDLKQSYTLYAVVIWHYHAAARVYRDVAVQIADDVDFTKNVHTVFNNDQRNELGLGIGTDREYFESYEGKLIDAKGVRGRYVRLYSNGNTSDDENHYVEVEVYGKTAPTQLASAKGVSPHATPQEAKQPDDHGDKVELKIRLPKPPFGSFQIIGPFKSPLDKSKRRPPFYVPRGVTNVALHKPVTASDDRPIIGSLSLVTDGDKESTDGSWVTFAPGKQWVQIDLEKSYNIYAIVVWHYHAEARIYREVVVQISDDVDFAKNVHTVFNADQHNELELGIGTDKDYFESNEGKLIDAKGIKGRYVRLYSKGNTSDDENNYTEVEVHGR